MASRYTPAAVPIRWILLIGTVLLAAMVAFGISIELELDSARMKHSPEYGYRARLPQLPWPLVVGSDGPETPKISRTVVLEDGRPLGPGHASHASIGATGGGRYSHWRRNLHFSTSDNSDPRTNGRLYVAAVRLQLAPGILATWFLGLGIAGARVAVLWLRRGLIEPPDLGFPIGLWSGVALSFTAATRAGGSLLWLLLGICAIALIWAVATTRRALAKATLRSWTGPGAAQNATLLAATLTVGLIGTELLLTVWERRTAGAVTAPAEARASRPPARERTQRPAETRASKPAAETRAGRPAAARTGKPPAQAPVATAPAETRTDRPPAEARANRRLAEARKGRPPDETRVSRPPAETRNGPPPPAARSDAAEVPEPELSPLERALGSFGVEVPREVLRSAARRAALITLPPELERAPARVEGAQRAYTWHGVLHVHDRNGMRRTIPFPARREHVFRVMVVGDSLTYGQGIEERWTYARQLEALLEPEYRVEVLNLGVCGDQSEDVLGKVSEFLPRLEPDLVIYGMCANDFLPSGIGQYRNNYAYAFPLPESVKEFFTGNSRLARLSEDAYNRALLGMGLRADFWDDILNGFTGYQQRFARDIARMNRLVADRGLPPVVALILDQGPRLDSRGHRVTQAAERYLEYAGMDVLEMDGYYRQFNGVSLRVSRWEGHPNEAANAVWAVMLGRHLRSLDVLRPFRKTAGDLAELASARTTAPTPDG